MADYNSDRTGSNIDAVLDKADNLTQAAVGVGGNVGIGTASPSAPLSLNRTVSDGTILDLRKDGTTVGSIGVFASSTSFCGASAGIYFNGTNINPTTGNPTVRTDGVSDIGQVTQRFKDLYLSGGVYLGGTGAANKLDDYEEGTWNTALSIPNGSVSYSHVDLTYTKIGRVVYINGRLDILSVSSPSGILGLTLPFAVSSSSKRRYSNISVSTLNFDVPDNILSQAFTAESGSVANLLQTTDNGSWFNADASILTGNEEFQISGFYLTDA